MLTERDADSLTVTTTSTRSRRGMADSLLLRLMRLPDLLVKLRPELTLLPLRLLKLLLLLLLRLLLALIFHGKAGPSPVHVGIVLPSL